MTEGNREEDALQARIGFLHLPDPLRRQHCGIAQPLVARLTGPRGGQSRGARGRRSWFVVAARESLAQNRVGHCARSCWQML